ncbi:MAG: T9SS type A sorting domain-containing protein, partial [Bacteroidota bacterium]
FSKRLELASRQRQHHKASRGKIVLILLVFDTQGRLRAKYETPESEIELASLPAGIYLLKLRAPDATYSARIVKTNQ